MELIAQNPLAEVIRYREVLANIISQQLKVKYRRTALGYVWSLLNPIINLAVLATVFSHVVRLEMRGYTQFLFSGLIAWTFVQTSLISSSLSLLENESFIKKIYLPKMLFPLSKVCLRLIDFTISMVVLTAMGVLLGFEFHPTYLFVPIAMFFLLLFVIGAACIVSVLTVYFRDVEYLLQVGLQLLYFATPILYPLQTLPERYHFFMRLNPAYVEINIFQQLIYYGQMPSVGEWTAAIAVSLGMFIAGVSYVSAQDQELVFRM